MMYSKNDIIFVIVSRETYNQLWVMLVRLAVGDGYIRPLRNGLRY